MRDKVLGCINKYGMISGGDTVLAALSGGADSVAMTHILLCLKERLGFSLKAAHINHQLRGEESERDEDFVRRLCEKWNIPLNVERHDIAAIAQKEAISCELAGRNVRYEAFRRLAEAEKNGKIATAHTLSDLMETMILNIIRGTGINGLAGIPPVRENIIRPLIELTRNDIEKYCAENRLDFVTDSTNLGDDFSRNKVRHTIIPAMYGINPSADKTVLRLSSLARRDEQLLSHMAQEALCTAKREKGYSVEALSKLPPSLLFRAIAKASGIVPEERQIELAARCICEGHGAVQLSSGKRAVVKDGLFYFDDPSEQKKQNEGYCIEVKGKETLLPDGRRLIIERISAEEGAKYKKVNNLLFINCFCCDKINVKLFARTRQSGDSFSPAGRKCTKPLKKLFNELSIAPKERENRVLLEANGEIIWIEGVGASESARADNAGYNIFCITLI